MQRAGPSYTDRRGASCSDIRREESPAARLLGEQGITRQDAVNFIIHGVVKGGGDTAV